jgi:AAA family ATP:ADP antiporter
VGSSFTAALAPHVKSTYLLFGSVVLLEIAVFSVRRLSRFSEALHRRPGAPAEERPIGGSILSGIRHALGSPYLVNTCAYILLFAITSTFLYFQQAAIVKEAFADRAARTAFFARVDLLVNVLTLGIQLFLTARVLRLLGVALTLAILPALSILGFFTLGLVPTIAAIVVLQVVRRAGNFALARPARELLFTVIPREDKYKAKSFIDTAVYRAGDQLGAWSYGLLAFLGLGIAGVAFVAAPLSSAWLLNALWLGRRQEAMAGKDAENPQVRAGPQ